MKITVNQLRRIIKEEYEDTAKRAERLRKAGSSGLDHPDFNSLSKEEQQEFHDTFGNITMAKLPSILSVAIQNGEKNITGDSPKEAVELIALMKKVVELMGKLDL